MDMVRHQAVRMYVAFMLAGEVAQERKIDEVVRILVKAGVPVVASLNDVQRDARKDQPWMPCHTVTTTGLAAG
jgi:hypothetical protein